jgi:tol-pal system protein YbgF
MAGRPDKVSTVLPSVPIWAPTWRGRSRAVSALAVCLLVAGLAPCRAQDGNGDADTAARIQTLEAEVAELKAMVGRLEALVRAKPSLAPKALSAGTAGEGDLGPRVSALETQIGALINQIEMMDGQLSEADTTPQADVDVEAETPPPPEPDIIEALRDEAPPAQVAPSAPIQQPAGEYDSSKPRWYGARSGQAEADDNTPQSILPPAAATGSVGDGLLESLAALPDSDAQALYEQGYGDYLQRDYAGAEAAFSSLVKDYPDDPLAGDAQYWVGETYYVRKQYKKAADTFLAGYRKYASSDKAPDTLLRLGMSLAALGQKDAACSTFKELGDKFPDAADHLRSQAKGEAGKAGCK